MSESNFNTVFARVYKTFGFGFSSYLDLAESDGTILHVRAGKLTEKHLHDLKTCQLIELKMFNGEWHYNKHIRVNSTTDNELTTFIRENNKE